MTAGIDAAVVRFFGEPLMQRVQHRIMDEFFGEQPVGTAFVLSTGHPAVPFLAHAPTMRVPGSIEGTDKVYSATWAALLAIHAHNRASEHKIEVAVFPAMGTGFVVCPTARRRGRWRWLIATTWSLPTSWIGTSLPNARRPFITTAGNK
jgi:O-acetyl-ADP-ribose deacetylase (regulator of RNase III)